MTAMRAEERPAEMAAGVLGTPAAVRPEDSAVDRAAVRWTLPVPAAETGAYGHAPASVTGWQLPPGSESASVPLRLTRRGRIAVVVMTAMLLAVLSLIIARSAEATSQPVPARAAQGSTQVTVRPGQSLWAVAESADPNADTRVVMQQIVELNALTGPVVFAGQQLWVPRG